MAASSSASGEEVARVHGASHAGTAYIAAVSAEAVAQAWDGVESRGDSVGGIDDAACGLHAASAGMHVAATVGNNDAAEDVDVMAGDTDSAAGEETAAKADDDQAATLGDDDESTPLASRVTTSAVYSTFISFRASDASGGAMTSDQARLDSVTGSVDLDADDEPAGMPDDFTVRTPAYVARIMQALQQVGKQREEEASESEQEEE